MAESTMTRAAPGDGEAAGALLATKELVKPEKSGSTIKGILAGAAAASFALGLLAAVTPSTRQAPVGLAGDRWSLTVEGGLGSVDPNYVSFVVDPASLEVVPKYPRYPYPVDFTSPALKALVKELAPALFVITGGNSNCISYADGFDPGSSPKSSADNYLSTYCEGKTYYGNLEPALFKTLLDFAADTGTDFVWHLNMAFGRGKKSPAYEPWDAGDATGLLAAAGSALKGAMLFEELSKEGKKLGFDITPEQMANDLALMKAALPSKKTVVYGVLNQDSDQPSDVTDSIYDASKDSIDVVAFSYYMNNAWRRAPENHGSYSGSGRCKFDPKQTAAFMVEPAHRATLDTTSKHFVELGESLGKPVQLIAGAPCTHNKEGTGYGAVDAHVGALWYADALGRVAKQGVRVFARQTLVGAVYGLLGTTTHKHKLAPTPGYWVAVLHKRLMGPSVLGVTARGPEGFSAYAHCSKGASGYTLLLVNFDGDNVTLTLPEHGTRAEYVLTSPDGLTTGSTLANPHPGKTVLNGGAVLAVSNGELPALDGRSVDGSTKLTVPAEAIAFVVMEEIADGISGC